MKDVIPTNAPVILGSGRLLSTTEVMALLGYRDSTTFWQAMRRIGLPFVRLTAKKAVFREADVEAWLSARTVGAPARSSAVIETAALR
ncbi:MAG: hypothetical protein H7067_00685 [Burkholderiales bacterium]|nr:hypothetical protein [Opitutaceae bacterium]